MKRAFFSAALLVFAWSGPGVAQAIAQIEGTKPKEPPKPAPEPAKPVPCAERIVRQEQWQLVEQQQGTTIEILKLKEMDAGRRKINDLELDFVESRQTGKEIVLKPREVEQEVVCYKTEAVPATDCNGRPCTVYKQVPVTHKVRVTVYDTVCEERQFIVRSPVVKPVEKEVAVKTFALERTQEPAIRKTFTAVHVANEFRVPIYSAPPYQPLPSVCPGPTAPCCGK